VWATNNQSTNKPVDLDIKKKLSDLPLKWANYFEINRTVLVVPLNGSSKAALSDRCAVQVKNLGPSMIQVGCSGKANRLSAAIRPFQGEIVAFGATRRFDRMARGAERLE